MNRAKASDVKKTLVRNPAQPVPKTLTVGPSKVSLSSKVEVDDAHVNVIKKVTSNKTRFNVPEMHSTLKLSKKIDEVVKLRKTKSLSDAKLAGDEKVTRKLNVPFGQQVFKDLIPLTDNEAKVEQVIMTRGPAYQKDPEPSLSEFLEARKHKVFYHKPRSNIKYLDERKMNIPTNNGLKLYKLLRTNDECT